MGRPKVFDTERIREDFINGFCSLRALAKDSGVSYSYISKLASSERWSAKRRERRMSVAEERAGREGHETAFTKGTGDDSDTGGPDPKKFKELIVSFQEIFIKGWGEGNGMWYEAVLW